MSYQKQVINNMITIERETIVLPPKKDKSPLLPTQNKSRKKRGYLLFCMLLPALLMYLLYLARGIHPFGQESVLVLDLNGQYVWFFEALRNFVKGDASLLYSFSRALGGEFLGIYAYYLASPLSFLLALFPRERMLEGLLVLFLLKTAICGGTFGYYMHKTAKAKNPFVIVAFATLYALCSYGIVQQNNTMWIDAMMWLPLITLGIESLIREGKFKLYTVFLAITLFSNFYIGYMVCIYCFFYFFFYFFGHSRKHESNPLGERAHLIKSLWRMAFYSLLAIGIAAFIILAAYYSLSFGKTTFTNPEWKWKIKSEIGILIYKLLPGSYDTVRPEGYPFIYCGVLTLLLLPVYFLSGKFSIREKLCSALFIGVFGASFSLTVLDLFWHGFQNPNWLNYRYSFMLSFFLCVLACRALLEFEKNSVIPVVVMGGLLVMICADLYQFSDGKYIEPHTIACILFTLIAVAVYLVILFFMRAKGLSNQVVSSLLICAVAIEVFLNGLWCMYKLDLDVVYSTYYSYNDYLKGARPIAEEVQASDQSFYRMEESTSYRMLNDNMATGLRGLSGSTSTLNQETIQFLSKLGYASEAHWSRYMGGTPVNDSLLGIKYIITDNHYRQYDSYYERYVVMDKKIAYKNPYALSLAYGVNEALLDFRLGFYPVENKPIMNIGQTSDSKIGSTLDKVKEFINEKLGIKENGRNIQYLDDYISPFDRMNAILTAMLGEEETVQVFVPVEISRTQEIDLPSSYFAENHICFEPQDKELGGKYAYKITVPVDGELYFYLPSNYQRDVVVSVYSYNDANTAKFGHFGMGEKRSILSLRSYSAGEELRVMVEPQGEGLYIANNISPVYYIDWEEYDRVFSRLAENQFNITEFTEDSFKGTLVASKEHQLVLTSLPYDEGWKITVDGKEVKLEKALGALISFYVDGEAGQTHEISMVYRPDILVAGSIISVVSIGLFALICIFQTPISKLPFLRSLVTVTPKKEKKRLKK